MAYILKNTINSILDSKKKWHEADEKGDTATANAAAENVKKYYEQLNENGYTDVADNLSQRNYTDAVAYANGLNYDDEQNRINTNNDVTQRGSQQWEQMVADKADMQNKYGTVLDYSMADPFKTAEGKSIMNQYNLAALSAKDNAMATGASYNGGNIDSNSAANAMRQQSALVTQGQGAVIDMYNSRLSRANEILQNLGNYNSSVYDAQNANISNAMTHANNLFNSIETAKNNDVARKQAIAETTGYAPTEWVDGSTNEFLNEDGTVKDIYMTDEFDNTGGFQDIINKAVARGDTETANQARVARAKKIFSNYAKYGQYDNGDYSVTAKNKTELRRQFDESIAQADRALNTEKEINTENNNAAIEQSRYQLEQAKYKARTDGDGGDVEVVFVPSDFASMLATTNTADEGAHGVYKGVDVYGARLLEAYFGSDGLKQGSVDDFLAFAREHSNEYNVDLAQLKKVCEYLEFEWDQIKTYITDKMENASDNWEDGVIWKTEKKGDE